MRAAAVLALALGLLVPVAAATPAGPALHLMRGKPVVLKGLHFQAGERVTVVLHALRPYGRSVTTRADGSFVVEFANASAHCVGIRAVARGTSGDEAVLVSRAPLCTSVRPSPGHLEPAWLAPPGDRSGARAL